jgi:proton-coupled amino acid transporter
VITCFGISVGYMIFVSDTVISMLPAQHAASFTTASMIARTLPAWLGLAFVRDFKGVNLISLLGTARPISSHWSPYDPVGVVNADP